MSIYFPEADVAIEVIPEPEGLPSGGYGKKTVVLYVGEDQVCDDALLEALTELIQSRAAATEAEAEAEIRADDAAEPKHATDNARTAEETFVDLLDAQDELADALRDRKDPDGRQLPSPVILHQFGDAPEGDDESLEDFSYEQMLEDWLDDICSPNVIGLRHALPSVNVGRCKNLYLNA